MDLVFEPEKCSETGSAFTQLFKTEFGMAIIAVELRPSPFALLLIVEFCRLASSRLALSRSFLSWLRRSSLCVRMRGGGRLAGAYGGGGGGGCGGCMVNSLGIRGVSFGPGSGAFS